jgi:hypothetical protein
MEGCAPREWKLAECEQTVIGEELIRGTGSIELFALLQLCHSRDLCSRLLLPPKRVAHSAAVPLAARGAPMFSVSSFVADPFHPRRDLSRQGERPILHQTRRRLAIIHARHRDGHASWNDKIRCIVYTWAQYFSN